MEKRPILERNKCPGLKTERPFHHESGIHEETLLCGCLPGQQHACLATQALREALKVECSLLPKDHLGRPELGCEHEEMRTEMEVLKQQVRGCRDVSAWRGWPWSGAYRLL